VHPRSNVGSLDLCVSVRHDGNLRRLGLGDLPLSLSARDSDRTLLKYFVAVAAASIIATFQFLFSVRFKGGLLFYEEPIGWAFIFASISFICASIFGLIPIWIARACARRFQWHRALPFVVFGALGSLSTVPPLFALDPWMMIDSSLIQFAIPGAVGGFVYWLCVRRHLPLSPKIR
jgi:hypothetical protein